MLRFVHCLLLSIVTGAVGAAPVQSLAYQAYLKDNAGLPVSGTHSITFRIYDLADGGTPLWSDIQSVDVADGLFAVQLGTARNPLPKTAFNAPLWLGVAIDTDPEAKPRHALNAIGNAFRSEDADTVGGMSAASLDQSAAVSQNAAAIVTNADGLAAHVVDAAAHHAKTVAFAELTQGQVATAQIADGAVTNSKISGPIDASKINSTGLDADTVDGAHASAFMPVATNNWVDTTGDTMNGTLRIDAPGRLGIGIVPAYPLHVNGDIKLSGQLRIGSAEYLEDAGANLLGTGFNSLQVGGRLEVAGNLQPASGILFADGSRQTTAPLTGGPMHIRVAATGGDYTSIQAALDAISPDPDHRYIIEIAPGTYSESVVMKSYVHLAGASPELTIIRPDVAGGATHQDFTAIWLDKLTDVRISGLALYGGDPNLGDLPFGATGIYDSASSPVVENVRIVGFYASGVDADADQAGFFSRDSSPVLRNSEIRHTGKAGIVVYDGAAQISGNRFVELTGAGGPQCAVAMIRGSALITGNYFTGNGAPLCAQGGPATGEVTIAGNQFLENYDGIRLDGQLRAQISGNHIATSSDAGTGIQGGQLADGTSIVGNTVIGHQISIHAQSRSLIMGNSTRALCAGGCQAIFTDTPDSTLVGNINPLGSATDSATRLVGNGHYLESLNVVTGLVDKPIILRAGSTELQIDASGNVSIDAQGDLMLRAGRDIIMDAGRNLQVDVGLNKTETIGANHSHTVGGSYALTASILDIGAVDVSVDAQTVGLNAAVSFGVTGDGIVIDAANILRLDGSSIDLNGGLIFLN